MTTNEIIKQIGDLQKSFCLSIVYGQKQPQNLFATQIAFDVLPILYEILELQGKTKKISFVVRSNGGIIDAPLPIINLIREYCEEIEIIIPENAHSAATLIALAGDNIIMTPMSSLSPIDPQINIKETEKDASLKKISFSVEDIAGYYQLLDKLRITDEGKIKALEYIAHTINPAILGQIERVRKLIHIYADKILSHTKIDDNSKNMIVKTLIEDIPSHHYMISRKEAKQLGLPVNNANDKQLDLLKQLMTEYKKKLFEDEKELILDFKEDTATIEKEYERAYIETNTHTYTFITKYVFHKNGKVDKAINQWRQTK